jgi:hypothetical protein
MDISWKALRQVFHCQPAPCLTMRAVQEGVRFRSAEDEGRAPTETDMFEDSGLWGQLAITAFKVSLQH